VLASRGDPSFGGADIDQALLEHVGAQVSAADPQAWRGLVEGRELADRRRRRVLRQDVRGAKETLSRHTYADVPMPPPFPDAHVTRDDLERLIAAPMQRTVALLAATVTEAGLRPDQLVGVFLVGGSSRIPMVSRLVHERLGLLPVTLDQPETVVARGALEAVLADAGQVTAAVPARVAPQIPGPPEFASRADPAAGQRAFAARGVGGHPPAAGLPASAGQGPDPRQAGGGSATEMTDRLPGPGGTPAAVGHAGPVPLGPVPLGPARTPRRRASWLVVGGLLIAAALGIALAVVVLRDHGERIADYHYRFTAPDGWRRSGGDQRARQVELGPADASAQPDRIFVTESELSYDADADRGRAVDELRAQYDGRRAGTAPAAVDGFDPSASFAGRDVLYYSEMVGAGTVDWYVLFGGRYQVSVGCRHDEAGAQRVRAACDHVVRTLAVDKG
jgi:molecular chaperone DnaK